MAAPLSRRIILWTPRALSALVVFGFALLGTDAFHQSGRSIIFFGLFLSHLIPAFLAIGAAFAVWIRPLWGGAGFLVLAVSYLLTAGPEAGLQAHLIITAPLALCGALGVISGLVERRGRERG